MSWLANGLAPPNLFVGREGKARMLVDHGPKGRGLKGMVSVAICDALREHQRLIKHRDVGPLARVGKGEGCEMPERLDVAHCLGVAQP